ncbi:MAG: methylmalonyl Co-A mutase-associated GTPase MeaB [Anaerolineaceae bacterium]|nr:methylmalonyl Co-A mutase-associated GTPase MeaB [Anaerolineaceae bacterium]
MADLAEKVLTGSRLALSRLITQIENGARGYQEALDRLFSHTGKAHLIGITGPSGSGKSTLVNRLAFALAKGEDGGHAAQIGIIAVDPTSPYTGGALLGDRVRMRDLAENPNIFIRSMATRGALGGIARAVDNVAYAMDAAGFGVIIIETVGAGQSEVEIARLAHTVIVVEAPGLGDDIQAAKAGILEIADILTVNKSDKPGAKSTAQSLQMMLAVGEELHAGGAVEQTWRVPVIQTSALNGDGIQELAEMILAHRDYLKESGAWQARNEERIKESVHDLIKELLYSTWLEDADADMLRKTIQMAVEHKLSPFQAVQKMLE